MLVRTVQKLRYGTFGAKAPGPVTVIRAGEIRIAVRRDVTSLNMVNLDPRGMPKIFV